MLQFYLILLFLAITIIISVFEAKWFSRRILFYFVKNVWSNYINGLYTYQLIKKHILKSSIQKWKNDKITTIDSSSSSMLKELDRSWCFSMWITIYDPRETGSWSLQKYASSRKTIGLNDHIRIGLNLGTKYTKFF